MQHAQQVWERRLGLADLKRKYPSLNDKGDEELLVDKEKPRKSETSYVLCAVRFEFYLIQFFNTVGLRSSGQILVLLLGQR